MLKLLKFLFLALLLFSCAEASRKASPVPEAAEGVDLEPEDDPHVEFRHPKDPAVKLRLARRYWCQGEKGVAVEQWLWLKQFAATTDEAKEARVYLEAVHAKAESEIKRRLDCSNMSR